MTFKYFISSVWSSPFNLVDYCQMMDTITENIEYWVRTHVNKAKLLNWD